MRPWFRPIATAVSLVVTECGVLAVVVPKAVHVVADPAQPLVDRFLAVCAIVAASAGPLHLALSRSLLPSVDGR
jgi:hypothetical protein